MKAMQGSANEYSYAQNSGGQNYCFHAVAKPRLGDAIKHLGCISLLKHTEHDAARRPMPPHHIVVADMGCSHGRNTLDCAEFVVLALRKIFASAEDDASSSHNIMEIQYFFSDLASNDFNALFHSLQPNSDIAADPITKFFAAGVPGSFYDRLFPMASLDLVICCQSLHWLSQVPPSLVDKASPAWNGGHTWISKAQPSKAVQDAYARQSGMDVRRFLKSRAHELISGGILFLFWTARSSSTPEGESVPAHDCIPIGLVFEFLDSAWKEMVDEGLIASEEMDMFNFPFYNFNQQELLSALKDVPELSVLRMDTIKDVALVFPEVADGAHPVERWVSAWCSALKPTVEAHVGKSNAGELFKKFRNICLNQDGLHTRLNYVLGVASLQRI